jgi:hypothetical protein
VLVRGQGGGLFTADDPETWDLLLRDRATGSWEKVDLAADGTASRFTNWSGILSANARFVAWQTNSSAAVPGMNPDMDWVAVLRDRTARTTEVISIDRTGTAARSGRPLGVSNNGRYAIFESDASDLAEHEPAHPGWRHLYLRNRHAGTTTRVSACADASALSADGRYLVFDACGALTLRELATGAERVVDTSAPGSREFRDAYLSADGRYLVYSKGAGDYAYPADPQRLHFFDRVTGTHELVGVDPDGQASPRDATQAVVTDDGRYVSFHTYAALVADGYDGGVFLRDRHSGTTRRASVDSHGGGTDCCATGAVSPDGRFVFFNATDPMVPADRNREYDLYVHEVGGEPRTPTFSFAINPAALDFGDVALGLKTSKRFWVRNTGKSGLPVANTRVVGPDRALISRSWGCNYLYPGASCAIRITVNAATPGPKHARLEVVAGVDTVQSRPIEANVVASGN